MEVETWTNENRPIFKKVMMDDRLGILAVEYATCIFFGQLSDEFWVKNKYRSKLF